MACNVIGRLGTNDGSRNAVREQKGMRRMVQLLKRRDTQPDLTKAIVEAITVLVADNEMNQDHVREEEGVIDIVRLLDNKISKFLASSAISCVTGAFRSLPVCTWIKVHPIKCGISYLCYRITHQILAPLV
jgi:hypothetical protein